MRNPSFRNGNIIDQSTRYRRKNRSNFPSYIRPKSNGLSNGGS